MGHLAQQQVEGFLSHKEPRAPGDHRRTLGIPCESTVCVWGGAFVLKRDTPVSSMRETSGEKQLGAVRWWLLM